MKWRGSEQHTDRATLCCSALENATELGRHALDRHEYAMVMANGAHARLPAVYVQHAKDLDEAVTEAADLLKLVRAEPLRTRLAVLQRQAVAVRDDLYAAARLTQGDDP